MSRAFDPRLLEAHRFPVGVPMMTRFADMDTNMHINNVALSTMFEDARVRFHDLFGLQTRLADRLMVAALHIDYVGQAHYPEAIDIRMGIVRVGNSSLVEAQLALQQGRVCALCQATIVNTDGTKAKPWPQAIHAATLPYLLQLD